MGEKSKVSFSADYSRSIMMNFGSPTGRNWPNPVIRNLAGIASEYASHQS